MLKIVKFCKDFWVPLTLMPIAYVIGDYLDKREDLKLSGFMNKSLLYKREMKPGEEATWK